MRSDSISRADHPSGQRHSCSVSENFTLDSEDLPAVYRFSTTQQLITPATQPDEFIDDEFTSSKFDSLGGWVWMAGRPYPPRPLNIQRVLKREIIATTEISLHLVWTSGRIFIKPIPQFLFSDNFYKQHLQPWTENHQQEPYKPALGFLYTYLALIPTELDFLLAKKQHLLPSTCDWTKWKELASRILDDENYKGRKIYKHIPLRYHYGELRLSRLDKIARYLKGNLHHGYSSLTESTRYADFIVEYLSPIAAAVAYVVVLLSAMQVGLATDRLNTTREFQNAAVGFALFALFAPLIAFSLAMFILAGLFLVNLFKSVQVDKQSKQGKVNNPKSPVDANGNTRNVEAQ